MSGSKPWRWLSAYGAAIVATVWLAPILATVATLIALARPPGLPQFPGAPVAYGCIAGVVFWLLPLAIAVSPFAYPSRANGASYSEIIGRRDGLRLRCQSLRRLTPAGQTGDEDDALIEAEEHLKSVDVSLRGVGLAWIAGNAYMALWGRLHRAEEALLGAEPAWQLVDEAHHDDLRLTGSAIPQRDDLLALLKQAQVLLSGTAGQAPDVAACRSIQKEVRYAINYFRDSGFSGLLRLRNQTFVTLVLTEFNAYALIAVALTAGARASSILIAMALYLIGAVIGVFSRLYRQRSTSTMVEDYGLSTARLLTLPVYSGLAGVGGVLLYGLTASLTGIAGSSGPHAPPNIDSVLDIAANPFSVVVAAAFGATPDILLQGLSATAEKYKSDITSTQTTGGPPAPGGPVAPGA
jgi:hypothetical protein